MTSFLYNSKICIGKKTIKIQNLIDHDVFFIGQLLKKDDVFLTLDELNNRYSTNINFLQYNSIISSIRKYTKTLNIDKHSPKPNYQPALNIILTTQSGTAPIYRTFIKPEKINKGFEKWSKITEISRDDWLESFKILIVTTNDPKLRWIQYRILHHILTTNRSVAKFLHNQSELCSFCNLKSETITHLFWECSKTQLLWKQLEAKIKTRCSHSCNFRFTQNLIIFGQCEVIRTDKICDFMILMAKFYIYRCKVQSINLNIKLFMTELFNRYNIERIICRNKNQFKNDWAPYINLFKSLL